MPVTMLESFTFASFFEKNKKIVDKWYFVCYIIVVIITELKSLQFKQSEVAYMTTSELLLGYEIKPSVIRIMIYDFLKDTKSHPRVDEIYHHILPLAPTLSRTPVYNSVKLFYEKGLLKILPIDGTQVRYDADTKFHGHFLCDCCKKVYDFDLGKSTETGLEGFEVLHKEVFYNGVCKDCNCIKN